MNRARLIAIVGLIALLAGCAAQSVDEIKAKPSRTHRFAMERNYEEVYRNIAQTARACWAGGFLTSPQASRIVDTDLYSESGKGEVTIWMSNLGPSIYLHALVERRAASATDVTVYTYYATWNSMADKVESWARGSKEC